MELNLFPTKISVYHNEYLALKFQELADEYLQSCQQMMGIDNHITTYNNAELSNKLNRDKRFEEIFNWCITTSLQDFESRGWDINRIKFHPHFFLNEIRQNGYFHRHAHPNATISGVFYLDAPDGCSDIIFHDPRPYKQCISLPCKEGYGDILSDEHHVQVKTGMLLLWNSWVEHEVPQNKSPLPRKTLVFNL